MTRTALALFFAAVPSVALAVPAQLTTQGRVLDSTGAPLEDTVDVTFRLMDGESGGTTLWEEPQTVTFTSGFYTVLLGADESGNPLEDGVLDQWPLYLEVQLDGEAPMAPRMAVGSVPYARQAGVAAELAAGADIEAGSLTVDGTEVVASDGTWTGPAPSVDWGDLTGVPGDFSDDDDADTLADLVCSDGQWAVFDAATAAWACDGFSDSTLTDADVVVAVGTDAVDLYAGSTMDGYTILTEDAEIDWSLLVSVPSGLDDGDDDTLAGLACTGGQIAVYYDTASAWSCGEDADTTLSGAEVVAEVESAGSLSLPGSTTVGGSPVVTSSGSVAWSQLSGVPSGLSDGDDDTLASTSCGDGEVLVYSLSSSSWACGTDTDSTLTSAEVQAMVEAVSGIALAAGATVDGGAILTAADHGADPDAHHSSTSDGIDITPASVTIQGTSTQLTDGSIDLGSSADDALSASMVQTLTGGGSADALHSHAAVSSGGGGACYVAWGTTTCGTGYTLMYAGYGYTAVENSYSTAGSGSYKLVDGAVGQTKCVEAAATLSGSGPTSGGSASGRVAPIWAAGSSLSNGYINTLECAMCCG